MRSPRNFHGTDASYFRQSLSSFAASPESQRCFSFSWRRELCNVRPAHEFLIMSQEYFPNRAGSSAGEGSSRSVRDETPPRNPFLPPEYMTVGNGTTSEHATALMASLNQDSGYGGSIAGDSASDEQIREGWRAGLMEDRPTPMHTPTFPGDSSAAGRCCESARRDSDGD